MNEIDTSEMMDELDQLAKKIELNKGSSGESSDEMEKWLRLAERSLEGVTHLTEYEDEKASRILQAVAFLSALAGGIFIALREYKDLSLFGGCISLELIFVSYAALTVLGASVLLIGVRPTFNIPKKWTGKRLRGSDQGDHPPGSRIFFEQIIRVKPKQWGNYFRKASIHTVQGDYLKDFLHEAYLVAGKLGRKVLYLKWGVRILVFSLGFLLTWVMLTGIAVFRG